MSEQEKPSFKDQLREYVLKNGNPKTIYIHPHDYAAMLGEIVSLNQRNMKLFGIDFILSSYLKPGELFFSTLSPYMAIDVAYVSDKVARDSNWSDLYPFWSPGAKDNLPSRKKSFEAQ